MSRFLPDDLFVGVEKQRLSFVRRSRGFKQCIVATFEVALPADFWETPDINSIGRSLPSELCTGVRASIVIADRMVRYFLVDRPQGARSPEEIELTAALRFEELFGVDAEHWQIQLDLHPWACNFLACALQRTHMALLQELFTSLRIPLLHISPFGAAQWNRHGRKLRASNVCFVALSAESAWLTLRRDRRWLTAHVQGFRDDRAIELRDFIRREFVRHGLLEQWSAHPIYLAGVVDHRIPIVLENARQLSTTTCLGLDQGHADKFHIAMSHAWPACK